MEIGIEHNKKRLFYGWQHAELTQMEYNRYKIEEINIGDEVYFDDVYSGKILTQTNFDEYWTVHGKDKNRLLVNFKEEHYWTVKVSEVRQRIKITK